MVLRRHAGGHDTGHQSVEFVLHFSVSAAATLLPKRCLRSLFRFFPPAIEQIRSDIVTPARAICTWPAGHLASMFGGSDHT